MAGEEKVLPDAVGHPCGRCPRDQEAEKDVYRSARPVHHEESDCWYSNSHHSSLKPRRGHSSLVTTSQLESIGGAVVGAIRSAN